MVVKPSHSQTDMTSAGL